MAQAISDEAIEKGTGKPFEEWLTYFEKINASELPHKDIVRRLYDEEKVSGWWCQMLTVAYEQHIGRRVAGQDCNGEFAVSVNKTLDGTMDHALALWEKLIDKRKEFSDITISRGPDVSKTDKWRYWRCGLADGSRVNINIYQKALDKAGLSIQHEKIESQEQIEHWRAYWKEFFKDL